MLFVERDTKGAIVAIRKDEEETGREPASLIDEEVHAFLTSNGVIEPLTDMLALSDASIVRVLEDLIDLLIDKKLILFTELPSQAQEKIRNRKHLRAQIGTDQLMVDDIL